MSQHEIYDALSGARTGAQIRSQGDWVHVAVAAEAHVRATHTIAAYGQRIIVKSGPLFYQDLREWYIPFLYFVREPDGYVAQQEVDLATELGIPNVPRGEPGSTKGISYIINIETKKAEVDGLTSVVPLKDMVAESMENFEARGYPGLVCH